jgi:hypothetical protein
MCMFCGHAGYLDEFCFHRKRIEKMFFEYDRNSYRDGFFFCLTLRSSELRLLMSTQWLSPNSRIIFSQV